MIARLKGRVARRLNFNNVSITYENNVSLRRPFFIILISKKKPTKSPFVKINEPTFC